MTTESDSPQTIQPESNVTLPSPNGNGGAIAPDQLAAHQESLAVANGFSQPQLSESLKGPAVKQQPGGVWKANPIVVILLAIALMVVGLVINNLWLGLSGAIAALLVSLLALWPDVISLLDESLPPRQRIRLAATFGILIASFGLLKFLGFYKNFATWAPRINWDAFGSLAEWFGALGQIFIAILAVYIAWQQYVISRDLTQEQNRLTTQQNILTQQQTIDAYFQGISELALDDEGLLEDWPQERAFSEGRTAAILGSVDASGKAKVLRFLSQSRLLTPLRRDRHLGRPILNGNGGYQEDRYDGVRVITLGIMLAGADLSGTDLRWTELSESNLIRANLSRCDLVKANFARTILYEANLASADLKGARFFYGSVETASPRSRIHPPNYTTGEYTGAVIENADFTNAQGLSDAQRKYCCAWGGNATRETIPGGCDGIANKLDKSMNDGNG